MFLPSRGSWAVSMSMVWFKIDLSLALIRVRAWGTPFYVSGYLSVWPPISWYAVDCKIVLILQAERRFIESQQGRRAHHRQVVLIQMELKKIRSELDRTSRGEDKYLELVTQEHKLVRDEKA